MKGNNYLSYLIILTFKNTELCIILRCWDNNHNQQTDNEFFGLVMNKMKGGHILRHKWMQLKSHGIGIRSNACMNHEPWHQSQVAPLMFHLLVPLLVLLASNCNSCFNFLQLPQLVILICRCNCLIARGTLKKDFTYALL